MNGKVFIDTSAWISYFFQGEQYHKELVKLFKELIAKHSSLYTSSDVVNETYTRLRYDVDWSNAQKFIDYVQKPFSTNNLVQLWTEKEIQAEAFKLLVKFSDHKLSLTDATSSILMKKHHIDTILTLDYKHFSTLGFQILPSQ